MSERRSSYALKLDAAGFGIGPDDYRSTGLYVTWSLTPRWMLALGYRDSYFEAEPGGKEDLLLDLHATGPKIGLAYQF